VRSSAIDEDQRDHTFAGVHLTELGRAAWSAAHCHYPLLASAWIVLP